MCTDLLRMRWVTFLTSARSVTLVEDTSCSLGVAILETEKEACDLDGRSLVFCCS